MNDSQYILEDALDLMRRDKHLPLVMAVEKAAENYSDPESTLDAMTQLKAVINPYCASLTDVYVACTKLNHAQSLALLETALHQEGQANAG